MTTAAELTTAPTARPARRERRTATAKRHPDRPCPAPQCAACAARAADRGAGGVIETQRGELAAAHTQHAAERAFDAGEIARLVAELAALNETCDRIARAGMREIDARDLGY